MTLGIAGIVVMGIYLFIVRFGGSEKTAAMRDDIQPLQQMVLDKFKCTTTNENNPPSMCNRPYIEIWGNDLEPLIKTPSPNSSSGTPQTSLAGKYAARAKCINDGNISGGKRIVVEYALRGSTVYRDLLDGIPFPCKLAPSAF